MTSKKNLVIEKTLQLSSKLWQAMHEENILFLEEHTHHDAMFVHMGVTLDRDAELEVIKNRKIIYQDIQIETATAKQIGATLIVLTKLKLTAVVDGSEVLNPFVVTEVYIEDNETIELVSLSYTRINY